MKKLLFIFNCHAGQIKKQLSNIPLIFDEIIIYNYLLPGYIKDNLEYYDNEDLEKIKNADILIAQNVINLRGKEFIGIDHIKTLIKQDCKFIKIPHYTFIGYFLSFDHNKTIDIANYGTKEEIMKNLENSLQKIKNLDEISDIKCYDFIKDNYQKMRLFHAKIYPTYHLFHFMAQEICKIIGYQLTEKKYSAYANTSNQIIFPNIKKYLELEFNIVDFCYKCTLEEYIIICKKLSINQLYLFPRREGKKHIKELDDLRKSL